MLEQFFPASQGFGSIVRLNYTDGVRVSFSSGEVVHIRPSGNADEMRFYAVASTQQRADDLAAYGVLAPDGVIFSMQSAALDHAGRLSSATT
jgi:phosphomannomutase